MMNRQNEQNLRLIDLFANKAFRIPVYQRGYAWEERQWNDFWDDIWDIQYDNINCEYNRHYVGTISLREIEKNKILDQDKWFIDGGERFYDVVDGQQRLTTIFILIFELINEYPDIDEKDDLKKRYIYRQKGNSEKRLYLLNYVDNDKNSKYLIGKIFEDDSVVVDPKYRNVYTNNLLAAKNWFKEKIVSLSDDKKKDLLTRLQTALAFDTKYISDNLSVQAVFETINNRGKSLTILEKLKNRLMFLATKKLSDQDSIKDLVDNINSAWGTIYDYLGKNPDRLLDEDEFISAHLTLLRIPADYVFSEIMAEKKVFEMFCLHSSRYLFNCSRNQANPVFEKEVDYNKIKYYTVDIANFVPHWYEVVNSDDIRIKKLLLMNSSKEMRLLLSELLKIKETIQRKDIVDDCIDLLLKIGLRNRILGLSVLDERTYASRARELHSYEIKISDFKNELKSELDMPCNVEAMIGQFNSLYNYIYGDKGFHRWSGLRFFLMEYENYLKDQSGDFEHVSWDNFDNISIEHIMPQSYETNWKNEMDDYYIDKTNLSDDEKKRAEKIIINTLGNLTILKDSKNSSLKNDPWIKKQERYKTGSFNEIEISKNKTWNKHTIWERGCKMLDFMTTMVDGLSFSEEQKKKLLFVSDKYFIE